ncbi:hypothetical protein V6N13_001644 [Hibiscus sabdariffa]
MCRVAMEREKGIYFGINLYGFDGGRSADWGMCFSIYCWLLWKLRCNVIFYVDYVDRDGVLERGSRLIDECEEAFALVMLKPNAVKQGGSLWEMPAAGLG